VGYQSHVFDKVVAQLRRAESNIKPPLRSVVVIVEMSLDSFVPFNQSHL
jgi:hypothetical protein